MMPDDESPERLARDASRDSDLTTLQLIEMERQSLGHDLHDAVIPLLFGAASAIASTINELPEQTAGCQQKLTDAHRWLTEAMQISRRMLGEIHPPELHHQSWVTAVRLAVNELVADHSIQVHWNIAAGETETLVAPEAVGLACYRIIVEATRNALAHSQADQISIDLRHQDSGFQIRVADNGVGFDLDQATRDRFGIRTMIGRAKLIGGKLTIDSRVGGPTSITLRVPKLLAPKLLGPRRVGPAD